MRQSEFDKINVALDRAEFAVKGLREKAVELSRARESAETLEEIAALNLEATELKQQLRKISDAVHSGNPAPHLRLVSDREQKSLSDRRQPTVRKRLLKSGKIFVGARPIPCTIENISETGACLQVQTTADIPAVFVFVQGGHPARTCQTIWRDKTQIGVSFIQRE